MEPYDRPMERMTDVRWTTPPQLPQSMAAAEAGPPPQPRSVTIAAYAAVVLALLAIVLMGVLWMSRDDTSTLEREFGVSIDEARQDLTTLEDDVDDLGGRVEAMPDRTREQPMGPAVPPVLVPIPTPAPTPAPADGSGTPPAPAEPAPVEP